MDNYFYDLRDKDDFSVPACDRNHFVTDYTRLVPLEQLESGAECPICREPYSDGGEKGPIQVLNCHTFCDSCLQTYISNSSTGRNAHSNDCPLCRKQWFETEHYDARSPRYRMFNLRDLGSLIGGNLGAVLSNVRGEFPIDPDYDQYLRRLEEELDYGFDDINFHRTLVRAERLLAAQSFDRFRFREAMSAALEDHGTKYDHDRFMGILYEERAQLGWSYGPDEFEQMLTRVRQRLAVRNPPEEEAQQQHRAWTERNAPVYAHICPGWEFGYDYREVMVGEDLGNSE